MPKVHTNRGQGSLKFSGPKAWAEIPKHLKEVAFRKPFSKKLKDHILTEIFVDLPKKVLSKDQLQYDELKMIFETEDNHDEFFGFDQREDTHFEISFLSENCNSNQSEIIYDLAQVFQTDTEDSDEEFLGFTNEESENISDLENLFLDNSLNEDFLGF